jgi:hypothetical protein
MCKCFHTLRMNMRVLQRLLVCICASEDGCNGQFDRCTRMPPLLDTSKQPGCREKVSTALFFQYNAQLGPPYQVLVDTNFINFAIKNKVRLRRQPPGAALRYWSLP